MQSSTRYVQCGLVLLAAAAVHFTWILAEQNGLFLHLRRVRDIGPHVLPGTSEPLRRHYTGISFIDYQLQVLMVFFFEVISGQPPAATIQTFHFAGQFGAAWTLLSLEAARFGTRGTILGFIGIWGVIAQNVAYAIIAPIFLATHLSLSKTTAPSASAIGAPAAEIAGLPVSMLLGYILPSVALALPTPAFVSFDQKQILNAIWQWFPVWVATLQQIFKLVLPSMFPALAPTQKNNKLMVSLLRAVYTAALLMAGVTHIASLTLPLAYDVVPGLFHPYVPSISFRSTFIPSIVPLGVSTVQKVTTIGTGAHIFLQYDELFGSASMLLWATYVYVHTWEQVTFLKLRVLGMTVVGLVGLLGPVGAAAALLWARDEAVLGLERDEQQK